MPEADENTLRPRLVTDLQPSASVWQLTTAQPLDMEVTSTTMIKTASSTSKWPLIYYPPDFWTTPSYSSLSLPPPPPPTPLRHHKCFSSKNMTETMMRRNATAIGPYWNNRGNITPTLWPPPPPLLTEQHKSHLLHAIDVQQYHHFCHCHSMILISLTLPNIPNIYWGSRERKLLGHGKAEGVGAVVTPLQTSPLYLSVLSY